MRDKNASNMLLAIIAVLVVLGGATGAVWVNKTRQAPVAANAEPARSAPAEPAFAKTAATARLSYDGVSGKTALELLKTKAEVVTKDSQYGPYVDSIDGIRGGRDNKYWSFYINGKLAEVGAGAYTTKTGDKIEWKLE